MRFLPEWFPGAGFKKQARLWRESVQKMAEKPLELSRELLVSAMAVLSFSKFLIYPRQGMS